MRAYSPAFAALALALALAFASPLPAAALDAGQGGAGQGGAAAADRDEIDRALVDRALGWLNATRSLTARFVQRGTGEGAWTGKIWMERPGQIRFEYDPPLNDVIWSGGGFVKHWDADLESVTHVPPSMTPAWFLLDDQVRVTDNIAILGTEQRGDRFFVTAARADDPGQGRITLAFQSDPDRMLGWLATDADGTATQVDLVDLVVNVRIPEKVFEYSPPVERKFN